MNIDPSLRWITDAIRNRQYDVGSIVPPVFDAYARIFHPAYRYVERWPNEVETPVSWQEVAKANRRVAHPAMQWGSLVGSWAIDNQPGLWDRQPDDRNIPIAVVNELSRVLKRFTRADSISYAVWDGYAEVSAAVREHQPQLADIKVLDLPMRRLYVKNSSIDDAAEPLRIPKRTADLWWPTDKQWFVATDVDLMTTYVGGNAHCVEAIVGSSELEAMLATSEEKITWDADVVNPRPAPPF